MKELIKPNLTEEECENNEVAAYCDLYSCAPVSCNLWSCQPVSGDDESGDILF